MENVNHKLKMRQSKVVYLTRLSMYLAIYVLNQMVMDLISPSFDRR